MADEKTKTPKLTADKLRETLWGTLNDVKNGNLKATEANSIATQAREICRITKLQVDIIKLGGKPLKSDLKKLLM